MTLKQNFLSRILCAILLMSGCGCSGQPGFLPEYNEKEKPTLPVAVPTYANVVYGHAIDGNGKDVTLTCDIFLPKGTGVNPPSAYIIFAHAGGFVGGDKVNERVNDFAPFYTANGIGFVSINYRLATKKDASNTLSIYRSVQDFLTSAVWLKRNADDYHVDSNNIFLMGTSAGGIMSLYAAYWDNGEIPINTSKEGPLPETLIKGIIPCWGGISDATILENESTPVYFFHTTGDKAVPCGHVGGNFGSCALFDLCKTEGIEAYLWTWDKQSHGVGFVLSEDIKNETLPFIKNHL